MNLESRPVFCLFHRRDMAMYGKEKTEKGKTFRILVRLLSKTWGVWDLVEETDEILLTS